jgi:hypothetical protein
VAPRDQPNSSISGRKKIGKEKNSPKATPRVSQILATTIHGVARTRLAGTGAGRTRAS